jgi:para-nitrobenzyl esterase
MEETEKTGQEFFRQLGVKTLAEARRLSADLVLNKALESHVFWGSVNGGKFLPGKYKELMFQTRMPVPILFGHTIDEFLMKPNVASIEAFKKAIACYGDKAERILQLCHANEGRGTISTTDTFHRF